MPGKTSRAARDLHRPARRVRRSAAAPGSLVGQFAEAPADAETKPVGQIAHWLFATGDTLAINAFRALAAARASHSGRSAGRAGSTTHAYLGRCLEEAMRLWPTTTMLSRETLAETRVGRGQRARRDPGPDPEHFLHRDRDRHD